MKGRFYHRSLFEQLQSFSLLLLALELGCTLPWRCSSHPLVLIPFSRGQGVIADAKWSPLFCLRSLPHKKILLTPI